MNIAGSAEPVRARIAVAPRFARAHWWLLLALLVTVAGFWPTTFGQFGPPDRLRGLHGALAATWMGLLVAQAWLAAAGRVRFHRKLGTASLAVAGGVVGTAFLVVRDTLPSGGLAGFKPPLLLVVTWIDLWSLVLFAGLVAAAAALRRRRFWHGRLLASTVFIALIPALGRLYGMNFPALGGLAGSLHPSFWSVELALLILVLRDARAGFWRSPWLVPLGGLLLIEVTMFSAPRIGWFVRLCEALGLPRAV